MRAHVVLSFLLFLSILRVHAHPTSYKDALAFMTWNQPFLNESWLTYSFEHDKALALRHMRTVREDDEVNSFYVAQYDLLIRRWNGEDSQANLYGYGGAGSHDVPSRNGSALLGGIEADAESRKYFILGKAEWMASSVDRGMEKYELRVGIAPYESEFEELGIWLMAQYQYHPWLSKRQVLTPLARFYYRNVLWELGTSFEGDSMLNLMFHF